MAGKIFYRERRKVGKEEKKPRFKMVAVADVDLIHCMSNHDWRSGWALSQTISAAMSGHKGVRATPYNMSEKHLKFYGYGRNGLMLTHGDGAKEEALTSLFLRQGKHLVNKCDLLYAYLHHFHHKKRKRRGIDVFEYTPLQVKQAVCGYGRADKNQVQQMVKLLLKLEKIPKPDDTADALAVAICHAHSFNLHLA